MTALKLVALGLGLAGLLVAQSEPIITVDKVMTADQLRQTGVTSLTVAQRAALDRWLSEYTVKVIGLSQKSVDPGPTSSTYGGTSGGHWIKSKALNGSMIVLEDGSMWQVNSTDRIYTGLWLPITNIAILKASQPVGDYKYTLVNKDDGEQALVKFLGKE